MDPTDKPQSPSPMSRREFIHMLGGAAAAATLPSLAGGKAPPPPAKPNVIFVFSDTHRWGAMSFTQTPQAHTPHMAAMAKAGVSMNHCFSSLPICTPYRAMIQTGQWPWQTGLMANHMILSKRVDLPADQADRGALGHVFRDAGYNTGYVGKVHLGSNSTQRLGYDVSYSWPGENHGKMNYSLNGAPQRNWTRADGYSGVPPHGEQPALPDHNYKIIGETDQALGLIDRFASDGSGKPFFVMLSLQDPHGPWAHHPPHTLAYYPDEEALPFPANDRIRSWRQHRRYYGSVTAVDDELGRVLAKVDQLHIAANTLIIYTSDHGGMGGAQNQPYGAKRHPHDESARVPFLVRWSGRAPAEVGRDELFSTMDIFPTLCGLANIPAHLARAADAGGQGANRARRSLAYVRGCPGLDFSPNILGRPGGPNPDSILLMHPSNMNNLHPKNTPVWRAVVTRKYTYALKPRREYCLYDRQADPLQMTNLVDDPAMLAVRKELWRKIDAWMDKAERPFLDNWFARMRAVEVAHWNAEHGFGKNNRDRKIGRGDVFDLSKSRPK